MEGVKVLDRLHAFKQRRASAGSCVHEEVDF